jgi:hypothetical protein
MRSNKNNIIGFAIFLVCALALPSQAQTDPSPTSDKRTLELVDHLKELIRTAEKDRRSDPWLVRQLRETVRRYDWPWRVSLLHDDFRDGDFSHNPSWIVRDGDFWVARGSGLRTAYDAARQGRRQADRRGEYSAMDFFEGILTGGREREARRENPSYTTSEAEIYTRLSITNAFAVRLQLRARSDSDTNNRFEFGPYFHEERNAGYRLLYESGYRPSLSLLRVGPRRSAVIESVDLSATLEDGNPHIIDWRRGVDGEMVVLLDDKEIIRTTDRAHSEAFDGFTLINKGGEYEVKQVSIFGTRK